MHRSLRALVPLGLIVLPVGCVLLALAHSGPPVTSPGPAPAGVAAPLITWRFFVALVIILVAARVVGTLVQRIGQPRVIGEMLAGILLGPSALGLIAPDVHEWVFSSSVVQAIGVLAQIGLALFMFLVGLELDHRLLRGRGWTAATIAPAAVAVPLALGVAVGVAMYPHLGPPAVSRPVFAFFIGVALSVTAFPVLARILMERGIFQTPLGGLAMICAAVTDVLAWILLAFVVAFARSETPAAAVRTILLTAGFVLVMWFIARPLLAAAFAGPRSWLPEGGGLALILIGVLLAAAATEALGIHLIFGAFIFGVVCPRGSAPLQTAGDKISDLTSFLLLPPFFALVGIRTDVDELGREPGIWIWLVLLLVAATAGKCGATLAAATGLGMEWRTALRLGVLMNCKGLTELVLLGVGLDLGLLSSQLFTVMVLVTLITTLVTVPALILVDRLDPAKQPRASLDPIATG